MPLSPIDWPSLYHRWGVTARGLERAYSPSRVLDLLTRALPSEPTARVLELGSAPGRWIAWVRQRLRCKVVGIELDPEGARLSRTLYPQVAVIRADARGLPFADGSFDAVFSIGLLEHFEDPSTILRETWRVLVKGGMCVSVVPNLAPGSFQHWHWKRTQPEFLAGHYCYDLPGLITLLSNNGFDVVHAEGNGLYVPHLQRVVGRLPFRWLFRRLEHRALAANLAVVAKRGHSPLQSHDH